VAIGSCLVLAGCAPLPLNYVDYESYVRPDINPASYRRAAILYVGHQQGSTLTQDEDVGTRGQAVNKKDEDRMIVTGEEARGADIVLFSNALMTALDRRGVQLVERARVRDVVREQGLAANQMLDLDDTELIQRIGRMLKVDLLVRGSVFSYQGGISRTAARGLFGGEGDLYYSGATGLTVRGIDTRTGQVVWMETAFADIRITPDDVEDGERISTALAVDKMVDQMVGRFMGQTTVAPSATPAMAPTPQPVQPAPAQPDQGAPAEADTSATPEDPA
jgi:hypothetical protein